MTNEEAFAYLWEERGTHFDPTCVDAFLSARDRILEAKGTTVRMAGSGALGALTVEQPA